MHGVPLVQLALALILSPYERTNAFVPQPVQQRYASSGTSIFQDTADWSASWHATVCQNQQPARKQQKHRGLLHPLKLGGDDVYERMDGDRVRRRQLLLSMLSLAPVAALAPGVSNADEGATTAAVAEESVITGFKNIVKAPLDDREYYTFTLENGLRVLLCSDTSTSEAAVAMDVHVGATSDPAQVPGLAHFNEHMLFLGTKQYPQENSFESFLSNNGGSSNAYTDSEDTVYYFDMEAESGDRFREGLLRFGSFFSDPLFTEGATMRELNAIESENKKNLQSDSFRVFQLAKAQANSDHPFSKFFTGNRKTLLEDTTAQGIDLRQELIKFYSTFYSANQMTLAIVAPQSLPELQKMATEAFSTIPNRGGPKPESNWGGKIGPYAPGKSIIPSFGNIVQVVPVQDLRQVTISWPIVYETETDRQQALLTKTSTYVAHLIGHEGQFSLLSYLKRKGWANTVAAASEEELSDFETFVVVVGLTSKGLTVVNDVVEAVYSYMTMIRSRMVPSYVLNEVVQLEELQWRFLTKGSPRNYAQSLASGMQKYPPEYYVAGPRRLALEGYSDGDIVGSKPRSGFSSKAQLERTKVDVVNFANLLTVDNALITVLSKSYEGTTNLKEKWYGTDYCVQPISDSVLNQWREPVVAKKLKIDFPKPNRFIPTEEGLKVRNPPRASITALLRTFEDRMTPVRPPTVIQDDGIEGRWKVFFKEDETFGLPKGYVVMNVLNRNTFSSAKKAALANLYEVCVTDRLGEYAYDAGLAGLIYEVKVLPRGVRLTFGGYSDKLKEFASYVSRKLSKDIRKLLPSSDNEFERYKDQIMRALSAFDVQQPYAHASYYSQLTLQPHKFQFTNKELRDETRVTLLPDLVGYAEALWEEGKGEALVQGNFAESEALGLVKELGNALPFRSIPKDLIPPQLEVLPLPPSNADIVPTRLLVAEPNLANENSASYVMLQSLSKTEKDHVMIELISSIVNEPFYDELRTKKQLGYIVSSGVRGVAGTRTLAFVVQSNVAPSASLSVEIIKFLDVVETSLLSKISGGDLAVYVKSLIDKKTEPDKDLSVEITRNWSEISSGRLQFDRRQQEAAALLEVTKTDLIEFWRSIYSNDGRRMLITELIPRQGPASSLAPPPSTGYEPGDQSISGLVIGVDDISQFRRDRENLV